MLAGSPAIDAVPPVVNSVDQRGAPFERFFDDPSTPGVGSDIGAFERQSLDTDSFVVNTLHDKFDFSSDTVGLREAIGLANGSVGTDFITFDGSVFTGGDNSVIRLTQGELVISENLFINATSATDVVITGDANGDDVTVDDSNITDLSATPVLDLSDNSRVLNVSVSGILSLTDLTITGGRTDSFGGGILFNSSQGRLDLRNSTVSGNSSVVDGGGIRSYSGYVSLTNSAIGGNSSGRLGGGILTTSADVSLNDSTVSGNTSGSNGGGILTFFGGVTLINSTVSGNSSGGAGGGIWSDDSTVRIISSTVADNSASGVGGGISLFADNFTDDERLEISNSIVAGNTDDGSAPDLLAVGDVTNDLSVDFSLIGDITGSGITSTTGAGNILSQSAMLGPLADNGGPTQTHALLTGSPAIDAGSNFRAGVLETDQRGNDRFVSGRVDIGAYEFDGAAPAVTVVVRDEGGLLARPDLLETFAVTFDQAVNLNASDLVINNVTLGTTADSSNISLTYDATNFTATFDFSGLVLDAGFYSFELPSFSYVEEVYVAIPGDANLDGRVDVLGDAFVLINNLGTTTNLAFTDGNFNDDGQVDVLGDAFTLINNLGRDVRPAVLANSNIQQFSFASLAYQSTDLHEQEGSTAATATSPATEQPQLVLAGDHDLRDDVFESEF